jgi:hypothetical protein
MSLDYSEFKKFEESFSTISNGDFRSWLINFMIGVRSDFIEQVKAVTPVDTGALRANWQPDGEPVIVGNEVQAWFRNDTRYAEAVEYGHAAPYRAGDPPGSPGYVEGRFMMTVTLDEIERELPQRFDSEFTAFLSRFDLR